MKTILLLEDLPEIRAWMTDLVLKVFPDGQISEAARVHVGRVEAASVVRDGELDLVADPHERHPCAAGARVHRDVAQSLLSGTIQAQGHICRDVVEGPASFEPDQELVLTGDRLAV